MLAQASHGARNIVSRHDLLQEPSLTSIPAHKSSNDLIGQQKYPSGRAIKYYHDMMSVFFFFLFCFYFVFYSVFYFVSLHLPLSYFVLIVIDLIGRIDGIADLETAWLKIPR